MAYYNFLRRHGKAKEANKILETAITMRGAKAQLFMLLIGDYQKRGQIDAAFRVLKKAVRKYPAHPAFQRAALLFKTSYGRDAGYTNLPGTHPSWYVLAVLSVIGLAAFIGLLTGEAKEVKE